MMIRQLTGAFVCLLMTATATAQVALYDAGTAGNPPVAPDPVSQGWTLAYTNGAVALNPISPDGTTGLNAWEMADNSTTDRAVYQRELAIPADFDFSVSMRVTASDNDYGVFMHVQDGPTLVENSWDVGFNVSGADVIATQTGWAGPTVQFVCVGGAIGYHTYSIRQPPGMGGFDAEFVYDGKVLGVMESAAPGIEIFSGVRFGVGAFTASGVGRARFQRAELRDLLDPIGSTVDCGGTIANSTGQPALLDAYGSTDSAGPGFALDVVQMPAGKFGYFLLSDATASILPASSQGRLCLAPSGLGRFNRAGEVRNSGPLGRFHLDVDPSNVPLNPAGPLMPGTLYFQAWYRDTNPGSTSNFSSAVGIAFQ